MADQNFREIQLSGKQLFFLFMTSVVVAVGVFLLGVSVGRGVDVNAEGPAGAVGRTAEVLPDGAVPGPTVLTPPDVSYHDNLQGTTTPPVESAPSPAPSAPLAGSEVPEVIDEPVPAAPPPAPAAVPVAPPATQKPTPPATASTAKPTPPAAATAKPAPAQAGGNWFVQVAAFRSRENADRQVRQLAAKGYPAAVSTGGGMFRVRVGPYGQRGDADRTAARLRTTEEGLKPSVTR